MEQWEMYFYPKVPFDVRLQHWPSGWSVNHFALLSQNVFRFCHCTIFHFSDHFQRHFCCYPSNCVSNSNRKRRQISTIDNMKKKKNTIFWRISFEWLYVVTSVTSSYLLRSRYRSTSAGAQSLFCYICWDVWTLYYSYYVLDL